MQLTHMKQIPWDATRTSPLTLTDCLHLRIRATGLESSDPGPGIRCGLPDRARLSAAGYQTEKNYPVFYDPWYAVKQCFSNCGLFISGLPNSHKLVSNDATKVTKMAKGCNCISNHLCCHNRCSAFFWDRYSDQHEDWTTVEYLLGSEQWRHTAFSSPTVPRPAGGKRGAHARHVRLHSCLIFVEKKMTCFT